MNEQNVVEVNENAQVNEPTASEKMFTQEDIDNAVKKSSAKYLRKIDRYKEELEESRKSEKVSKYVAEKMGYNGPSDDLFKKLAEHYGDDVDKVLNDLNNGDLSKKEADIKLETYEFLNDEDTTDDDIVEEFERISGKPKSKQSKADLMKLDLMAKRYYQIVAKGNVKRAEKWYNEFVGDDFEKLIGNEKFRAFTKDLDIPLDKAVIKYCELKGLIKEGEKKESKPKISSGSAKDTSGDNGLGYFTQEQVAKMSREEIKENYDAIVQSRKSWYKKG